MPESLVLRQPPPHLYAGIKPVLRTLANSLLSLMMVVTLMWGGCISCPQFFMFPSAKKSCCNKSGQCERPVKTAPLKECKQIPLELQPSAHIHFDLPPALTPVAVSLLTTQLLSPSVDPSPPDLNLLNSIFLI